MRTLLSFSFCLTIVACHTDDLPIDASSIDEAVAVDDTGGDLSNLPDDQVGPPAGLFDGFTCVNYDNGTAAGRPACIQTNILPVNLATGSTISLGGATFLKVFQGDHSRPGGQGWESLTVTGQNWAGSSSSAPAERGAVCGFGHTGNAPTVTCFDRVVYSPAQRLVTCPTGFTANTYPDANSPGHSWYWCAKNSSTLNGATLQRGYTCGMHGSGSVGYCGTAAVTTTCPANYTQVGFYDMGRPAGQGLMACVRR